MRRKKLAPNDQEYVERVRAIEERLFAEVLDETDVSRMKSDRSSWHYRPSHHIESDLLTQDDIALLSEPGRRLLSIGAFPLHFERMLCELGVPAAHILAADSDPAIAASGATMQTIIFDATKTWPEIGTFDRIIFPESLCIAVSDVVKRDGATKEGSTTNAFPHDDHEAEILSRILAQALARLRPDGEIRANGPQSHPKVIERMREHLRKHGHPHALMYDRFFLTVRSDV